MKKLLFVVLLFACFLSVPNTLAEPSMITVGEFEIEYEIAGEGEQIVLLEAGGSAGMSDWDPVFEQVSEFTTVIRYSRVGNGNSTQIRRHFTSIDYAQYAQEFLNELGISKPVIFVAHSYGGSVAREFAAAYPESIEALLMLDPSSEHDVDVLRAIDLERGNKEIEEIKLSDMANGMSNQYLDFWSKRPLPDYAEIGDIPVTVVTSVKRQEDPANLFFTDQGRELWGQLWQEWTAEFPQGRSVLTEKSGHFVQFDEPELVLHELRLLMESLD